MSEKSDRKDENKVETKTDIAKIDAPIDEAPPRDLDFRTDFDGKGELDNPKLEAHFASEREKMLGDLVGTGRAAESYAEAPATIEKAPANAKAAIVGGDTADILAKRYSKTQLTDLADEMNVAYTGRDSMANIAIALMAAHDEQRLANTQTALNTTPAAPELNTGAKGN